MPNVRIDTVDGVPVCSGLHFDHPDRWPKLLPGQVVNIPEDAEFDDGKNVLNWIMSTNLVVATHDAATRRLNGESLIPFTEDEPEDEPEEESET